MTPITAIMTSFSGLLARGTMVEGRGSPRGGYAGGIVWDMGSTVGILALGDSMSLLGSP